MTDEQTKAFLFADIVDSTERWRTMPDAMRIALADYNQLTEDAISESGGTTFKRVGDSTCAVFDTVRAALAAAVNAQRRVAQHTWPDRCETQVRWSVHIGTCFPEGDDFLGPALNQVARILNLAYPGQILVSGDAAPHVDSHELKPEGQRKLKGLGDAITLFSVVAEGLERDFPPLPGADRGLDNLPTSLNSFVGRQDDIATLGEIIRTRRLVTVTGPGGTGKTRLVIETVAGCKSTFTDGVWFVGLASLTDPKLIAREIARAVGLRIDESVTIDSVIETLASRHTLIVLDNCEHVLAEAAQVAHALVSRTQRVTVVATSRIALQVSGETRFGLAPLDLDEEDPLNSEAMILFVDRAQAVDARFTLTPQTQDTAIELVRHLGGIPLALELAAAQLNAYSLDSILRLLKERALALAVDDPTAAPHRQSLATTIDWSYQLLDEEHQTLLRSLSVFRGGFTLDAAQCVGGHATVPRLSRLVLSSLVQFDPVTGRYSMLEMVREFMADQLALSSDEWSQARTRHLEWIKDFAEEARPQLDGPRQVEWLDRLEHEHPNVREAMTWAGDAATRIRAAVALHWFWIQRGHVAEGLAWLSGSDSASLASSDPLLAARAGSARGVLQWSSGRYEEARESLERARDLATSTDDVALMAGIRSNLAMLSAQSNRYDLAESEFVAALEGFRATGDRVREVHVLNNLAVLFTIVGRNEEAGHRITECINLYLERGDVRDAGIARSNLASCYRKQGRLEDALVEARRSAEELMSVRDVGAVGKSMMQISLVLGELERWRDAAVVQGKAISVTRRAQLDVTPDLADEWHAHVTRTQSELRSQSYDLYFNEGTQYSISSLLENYSP